MALLALCPFGSYSMLSNKYGEKKTKQNKKKTTSSNWTLKLRESLNPNEVSPVEIIITEGYLVEYSRKWWKTAA